MRKVQFFGKLFSGWFDKDYIKSKVGYEEMKVKVDAAIKKYILEEEMEEAKEFEDLMNKIEEPQDTSYEVINHNHVKHRSGVEIQFKGSDRVFLIEGRKTVSFRFVIMPLAKVFKAAHVIMEERVYWDPPDDEVPMEEDEKAFVRRHLTGAFKALGLSVMFMNDNDIIDFTL